MFLPCEADKDFLEITFSITERVHSRRVMNVQIFMYIAYVVSIYAFHDAMGLNKDHMDEEFEKKNFFTEFSLGYMLLASILPIL